MQFPCLCTSVHVLYALATMSLLSWNHIMPLNYAINCSSYFPGMLHITNVTHQLRVIIIIIIIPYATRRWLYKKSNRTHSTIMLVFLGSIFFVSAFCRSLVSSRKHEACLVPSSCTSITVTVPEYVGGPTICTQHKSKKVISVMCIYL